MSTESPLNAKESAPDIPLEAQEYDSTSPKHSQPQANSALPKDGLSDGSPPLPVQRINESWSDDVKKKGKRKKKGRKKKGKAGGRVAAKPRAVLPQPGQAIEDKPLTSGDSGRDPQAGEEGVCSTGCDRIGLHPEAYKNVDQKGTTEETQPIEGVEDVLGEGPIEEVETRAAAYAKVKAVWEKAGDVCVRVYARPLNPRLVLVEWEGEDGVEKHGKIVVGERQRGMFGPGKVVWVRGPLVGDRWVLAGKYNFLGNRVS